MSHSIFKKIAVWTLLVTCLASLGAGSGRTVVCLEQSGEAAIKLLRNFTENHCRDEHLHKYQLEQNAEIDRLAPLVFKFKRGSCSSCNDFEVSLQLRAPRSKTDRKLIKFISKTAALSDSITQKFEFTAALSPQSTNPPRVDPSLTHIKSTILLI